MSQLHNGDCFEVMQGLPDNSVDLVLTDPPYGLAFMGKKWDYDVPPVHVWYEALRVLKPGGHLLAFAGTRTQHRMACRIEDAGFEIRDMLAWVYGSGFPKSLDVSKAIDKAAGAEREVVGPNPNSRPNMVRIDANVLSPRVDAPITAPATDAAREWDGWGTALKPALEPITMARKPLIGTVVANVLEYGTGGLNIDECRVGTEAWKRPGSNAIAGVYGDFKNDKPRTATGRWPANLLHDGSEEVTALFPESSVSGAAKNGRKAKSNSSRVGSTSFDAVKGNGTLHCDSGSAARFFYCAKSSKRERGESNTHPTVKPIALMEYLVQLASRPGAVVLDPFMGSGTTGIACRNLGREFIGIEMNEDYFEIAKRRIEHEALQMELPA